MNTRDHQIEVALAELKAIEARVTADSLQHGTPQDKEVQAIRARIGFAVQLYVAQKR